MDTHSKGLSLPYLSFMWSIPLLRSSSAHADITVKQLSSGAVVTYTSPATSDIVDGAGAASCVPASGTSLLFGNTLSAALPTDTNGNHAIHNSFVVHVVDTTAPVIAPHADVYVAATSSAGAVVNYTSPATSDAVDGPGTAICDPPSGTQFALGDTTLLALPPMHMEI
jgi:hypothetical protein